MTRNRLWQNLVSFPWRTTLGVLRERFHEDHLPLTAGSLTFTTTMALVPFFTVALALFTAFPMFSQMQDVLQKWLVQSLIPDNISRQVLGYLTQFSSKSSRLGLAGLVALLGTSLALILTIDRTLNNIWRVRKRRRLSQRILIYWAVLTLGPLLLAASLSMTSYVLGASRGWVGGKPVLLRLGFDALEFVMLAGGAAALFHYVPHTDVKPAHAWAGGVFVAAGIEIAKKLLTLYLGAVPSYSLIYGAFATVPIFLTWIYTAWLIVLSGAVVAAYLPSLLMRVGRYDGSGWQFQLALAVLDQLDQKRGGPQRGATLPELAHALRAQETQLEPVVDALLDLDWLGELADRDGRYVLLADPDNTLLAPLMDRLLLSRSPAVERLWREARWPAMRLRDVLGGAPLPGAAEGPGPLAPT